MGKIRMIDISEKSNTLRTAIAKGEILMKKETIEKIKNNRLPKGNPLEVARVAGIMAAKNTPGLLPLCHPLLLTNVDIEFDIREDRLIIKSKVTSTGKTGVEMEALTALCISALAIYDVCKTDDKEMKIDNIRLIEKVGGRSGSFHRKE